MIKFEKISLHQYIKDCLDLGREVSKEQMVEEWSELRLPTRATAGSAGYDFFAPYSFTLKASNEHATITIPTGIRFITDQDLVLLCMPRSGQGFKYGLRLQNTIGVIDRDYYQSDNEGHIKAKLSAELGACINQGQGYMQGLIIPFYTVDTDDTERIRNGGFGSTDRR